MDLAHQVAHVLRERGEIHPVPVLGGFVVEARAPDLVAVYWRVPGPVVLGVLRRRYLRRYRRLLDEFGLDTTLAADGPEPCITGRLRWGTMAPASAKPPHAGHAPSSRHPAA